SSGIGSSSPGASPGSTSRCATMAGAAAASARALRSSIIARLFRAASCRARISSEIGSAPPKRDKSAVYPRRAASARARAGDAPPRRPSRALGPPELVRARGAADRTERLLERSVARRAARARRERVERLALARVAAPVRLAVGDPRAGRARDAELDVARVRRLVELRVDRHAERRDGA